jgi:hypothetical protein
MHRRDLSARLLVGLARTLDDWASSLRHLAASGTASPPARRPRPPAARPQSQAQARRNAIAERAPESMPPAHWLERINLQGGPPAHWLERVRGTGLAQGYDDAPIADTHEQRIPETTVEDMSVSSLPHKRDGSPPSVSNPARPREIRAQRAGVPGQASASTNNAERTQADPGPPSAGTPIRPEVRLDQPAYNQSASPGVSPTNTPGALPLDRVRLPINDRNATSRPPAERIADDGKHNQPPGAESIWRRAYEPSPLPPHERTSPRGSEHKPFPAINNHRRPVEEHTPFGGQQPKPPMRESGVTNRSFVMPNNPRRPVEQHATYIESRFPSLAGISGGSQWPELPTPSGEQYEPAESSVTAWDSVHAQRLEVEQRRMQGLRDV